MKNIKLNQIEKEILSKKEMNQLKGGQNTCGCACAYEGTAGGSSTYDNGVANSLLGVNSVDKNYKILVQTREIWDVEQ